MAKKIRRGLIGQQERGFSTGGRTYGYRALPVVDPSGRRDANGPVVIGKRVEVDPEQAAVIRDIYQWYVAGMSHPKMVDRLNREQVPSPRGTPWTKHHIDRILRNERYLGKQIWRQTTYERRPGTNKVVARKQPREAWHVQERPDLRIIDDDLWQRVRARRAAIKKTLNIDTPGLARGRSGLYSKYLLVGLARCGVCGKRFTIVSSGNRSPRYGCPSSWRNGMTSCDNRLTTMAKVADPAVLGGLQAQLLEPSMVRTITEAVTEGVRKALAVQPAEQTALERRRISVAKKVTHLVAAIEQGIALPAVTEQLLKRQAELRQIENELDTLGNLPDVNVEVIPTWVRQQLENLSGLLAENPERAKAELRRLNVQFIVSPVRDQKKPFLQVEGSGDLDALCGMRNLPSVARSHAQSALSPPLSTSVVRLTLLYTGRPSRGWCRHPWSR